MQLGNIYNRDERLAKGKDAERADRSEGDSGVDNNMLRAIIAQRTGLPPDKVNNKIIRAINDLREAHQKGDATMTSVYRDDFREELIYGDVPYTDKESFLAMFRPLVSTLLALTPESDPHGSKIDNLTIEKFLNPYLPGKTVPEDYLISNLHAYRTATNKGNPEEIKRVKITVWQGLKNHGKEMSQVDFEKFLQNALNLVNPTTNKK